MYLLKIAAHGDNEGLHLKALAAAVEEVERVNSAPVYRAWLEKVDRDSVKALDAREPIRTSNRLRGGMRGRRAN